MATAQMPGRSARLADDAATAALYATHPRRKASLQEQTAPDNTFLNQRTTGGAANLSAASAGAALAHANQKPIEVWRPGRFTDAEKAAWSVRDFTPPEFPQPSTGYSAEGLGAAIIAVREQRASSVQSPTQTIYKPDISNIDHSRAAVGGHAKDKALRAATGAYASRKRADSAPSEPAVSPDAPYALTAAGASHRARFEDEGPLEHIDPAMEASRIQHSTTNARMYTSSPPVATEVEERNRRNSLHAAALVMAKNMYDASGPKGEAASVDPAIYAAQEGQNRLQYRKTVSGAMGTTAHKALALQEAAQKRAAEKLARMRDDHRELQDYYGTAPQPQRSRLTTRRRRTSSDADQSQADAEKSRQIRNQMTSLRTKMDRVDVQRQKDRDSLMEAARRNVDATILDMEMKMYNNTGRAPPSIQKQWDEAARERVRREAEAEAEAAQASGAQGNRVNIGAHTYMDMADVEAVARSRVQPALDEITDQAEERRAQELEARLDAEEKQRQAGIEKEREASLSNIEREKGDKSRSEKRQLKGLSLLLFRKKSKRTRGEKPEEQDEIAQEPTTETPTTTAAGAVAPTHDEAEDRVEEQAKSKAESKAESKTEAQAEDQPEVTTPAQAATSRVSTIEEPGPSPIFAAGPAAPIAAPVRLVTTGPSDTDTSSTHGRHISQNIPQRDAAATAGISDMHRVSPITSPRADSKLKNWFRDRLVRRSSGPVPVYPHQPGPDFRSTSEIGFTGGAALTGSRAGSAAGGAGETRSAALSSHPVTGMDLDTSPPRDRDSGNGNGGTFLEMTKTTTGDSASDSGRQNSNGNGNGNGGNGNSKRHRFRKSFMKTLSRNSNSQEPKTNGFTNGGGVDGGAHSRQNSTFSETKVSGTGEGLRGLRDSAHEQGLPAPPILGQTASTGRESRFSEDL